VGSRGPKDCEHLALKTTREQLCIPATDCPLPESSYALIQCEHVLEDLSFAERATMLLNLHKLLLPNGVLRLVLWNDHCRWLFDEGESPGLASLTGFHSAIARIDVDPLDGNPASSPLVLELTPEP
jgi:hypothetical protein